MKVLCKTLIALVLAAGVVSAQPLPNSTPTSSYISVMSKAGTPTPQPSVPVRYVNLPPGAGAGYDYYYGYGSRGFRGGSPSPSYANEPAPPMSGSLPGYDTRPRSSSSKDGFNYGAKRRRR
jgi:hypothetical protein